MNRLARELELRPNKSSGWRPVKNWSPPQSMTTDPNCKSASAWRRREVYAVSSLQVAESPDGALNPDGSRLGIPQWQVSFSARGPGGAPCRPRDEECRQALACFFMSGAEEDNHEPGIARHFWMPVDPKRRVDCECKTTERVVVEPDGHRWSTPKDEAEGCNGCKNEAAVLAETGLRVPCTLHPRDPEGEFIARQLAQVKDAVDSDNDILQPIGFENQVKP